jgi:hypothetical protein
VLRPEITARITLTLDARAAAVRRSVGPTAWVVLEELLACSTDVDADVDGMRRAVVSVRALAASIGLAKDTVARALRRLCLEGLLVGEQRRTERGVFDAGSYRVTVPAGVTVASRDEVARPTRRAGRVAPPASEQLALAIGS